MIGDADMPRKVIDAPGDMHVRHPGSWIPVFWVAVACDLTAAVLAFFWLKPLVAGLATKRMREAVAIGG